MEQLRAVLLLAWAMLRTVVAPLFGARRALAAFVASYARDRLPPVSAAEREALATFGGCVACGLCDVGESARIVASGGTYAGVMDLVLASSRNMPDFDVAARSFDAVGDARLAALEQRCPTGVPMRKIASFVRTKSHALPADAGAETEGP